MVGNLSLYPFKQDCVIANKSAIENHCASIASPCAKNTNCSNSENSAKCTCQPGYIGNPYNPSLGCKILHPELILIIKGKLNLPIDFQVSLKYNYSDENRLARQQIELLLDRILREVEGYIEFSSKVSDLQYAI